MARLTDKKRDDIRNALIIGKSQYSVSQDFEVSSSTVNKIFKTIDKDEFLAKEVKAEIAIKSKVLTKNESLVKAFDDEVKEKTRHLLYFQDSALKNQRKANSALEIAEKMSDIESHARLTSKNKETVLGKEPEIINNTQINNNVNLDWEII